MTVTVKSWFFVTVTGGEKNIHRHRHRRKKTFSPSPSPPNKKIFTVTVTAGRYFFHRNRHRNRQIYFLPSQLQSEIISRIYQPKHHTLSQRSQYRFYWHLSLWKIMTKIAMNSKTIRMTLLLGWSIYYVIHFFSRGDRDLKFIWRMMTVIMRPKNKLWGVWGEAPQKMFEILGRIFTIFA